jgi:hypothetical protein
VAGFFISTFIAYSVRLTACGRSCFELSATSEQLTRKRPGASGCELRGLGALAEFERGLIRAINHPTA